MNWLNVVLVIFLILTALIGLIRGSISTLIPLVGVIVGVVVAGQFPEDISQQIIHGSNDAFTSGMVEAMFIGGIIMAVTTVLTLLILPSRIRPAWE
jgi:uncharacterized membrane protein required for colicin V production